MKRNNADAIVHGAHSNNMGAVEKTVFVRVRACVCVCHNTRIRGDSWSKPSHMPDNNCNTIQPTPGSQPVFETWRLGPDGAGLEAHLQALQAASNSNTIPNTAAGAPPAIDGAGGGVGRLSPPSDALLLALPDGASAADVEGAVAAVVERLVPAFGWDVTRDVQVCTGWVCSGWLCVGY